MEAELTKDFTEDFKDLITKSQTFNLVGIKGVGVTVFFKHLIARKDLAYFVYIDIEHLAGFTKKEFYLHLAEELGAKSLGIETRVKELLKTNKKVVFIFNHFDLLKPEFDDELFVTLRNLRSVDSSKVMLVFYSDRPIHQALPEKLMMLSLTLLSKIVYFPLYSENDLEKIAKLYLSLPVNSYTKSAAQLSGGHSLLFQLLLRTEFRENPLLDPFIKFHFRELIQSLSYKQRKLVEKVAFGEKPVELDSFLVKIGFIKKETGSPGLYSPLMEQYLRTNTSLKLSVKENKLFRLLKKNLGKVVGKDQIFETIWKGNEEASDWALNSMIYRIRNNPAFKEQGFDLISHKKLGYRLVKD